MERFLTIFIHAWVGLIAVLNIVGIVGQFWLHGFSGGVDYVQEIYSPFNIKGYFFLFASLFPAYGAYVWRERLRKKSGGSEKQNSKTRL